MAKIEPIYKKLGVKIDAARRERGLLQEELAKAVGISRPSLANMVAGRQRIYLHHVLKFEKVLKVKLLKKCKKEE